MCVFNFSPVVEFHAKQLIKYLLYCMWAETMDMCVYAAHIHMLDKIMMRLETQNKSHQVSMSDFNIVTTILATSYNVTDI